MIRDKENVKRTTERQKHSETVENSKQRIRFREKEEQKGI
jgi:hypothetical protein